MIKTTAVSQSGQTYIRVDTDEILIRDTQSALDLIATIASQTGCDRMAIPREALDATFFRLATGLAGEVLQKFVNYQMKLAIFGDFTHVTSKMLMDFIAESNRGNQVFFAETAEESGRRLCGI